MQLKITRNCLIHKLLKEAFIRVLILNFVQIFALDVVLTSSNYEIIIHSYDDGKEGFHLLNLRDNLTQVELLSYILLSLVVQLPIFATKCAVKLKFTSGKARILSIEQTSHYNFGKFVSAEELRCS